MMRDIDSLGQGTFDLLVVGGGIHGVWAAWDAARRGLRVALLERDDFGSGASSNSSHIAHGGFRYLQRLDVARVRESAREQARLLRLAPHLVRLLPCVMPSQRRLSHGPLAFALALRLFSIVRATSRTASAVSLPHGRVVDGDEYAHLAGRLALPGATGGLVWYDAIIDATERLLVELVHAAVAAGAVVANHVEAVEPLQAHGRIAGVRARSGRRELEVRARVVLNTALLWGHRILGAAGGRALPPLVRSCNLVMAGPPARAAVAIPTRGGRLLFAVPWRGHTILGTTERPHDAAESAALAAGADARALLDTIAESLPSLRLRPEDVHRVHVGVLPGEPDGRTPLKHPMVEDHGQSGGLAGLVTLAGVKWTTARAASARAIDVCVRRLGAPAEPRRAADLPSIAPSCGGPAQESSPLPEPDRERLRSLYGHRAAAIEAIARESPELAMPLGSDTATIGAEIAHAVRHEWAIGLGDVVMRRTEMGAAGLPGDATLRRAAELAGRELGREAIWAEAEVRSLRASEAESRTLLDA